jgi:hypothetical protein
LPSRCRHTGRHETEKKMTVRARAAPMMPMPMGVSYWDDLELAARLGIDRKTSARHMLMDDYSPSAEAWSI